MMSTYLAKEIADGICVVYIDDIMIHGGTSREDHFSRVRRVLRVLSNQKLTIKLSKCNFGVREVEFLGHKVSAEGRCPLDDKVAAINNWDFPADVRDLRRFLGLAEYYHDNVARFSHLAAPLHRLTTKDGSKGFGWSRSDWEMDTDAKEAFLTLKKALVEAPILRLMAPTGKRRVVADASRRAIAAVLEQPQDGKFRPVAYFSRTLEERQTMWPARTLELLAIRESLKTWRHYLLGHEFEVLTDHQSLTRVTKQKDIHEKQAGNQTILGMLATIAEFHPTVSYIAGADNSVADALSRAVALREGTHGVAINSVRVGTISQEPRQKMREAWNQEDRQQREGATYWFLINGSPTKETWQELAQMRFRAVDECTILYQSVAAEENSWVVYVPQLMRKEMLDEMHARGHYATELKVRRTIRSTPCAEEQRDHSTLTRQDDDRQRQVNQEGRQRCQLAERTPQEHCRSKRKASKFCGRFIARTEDKARNKDDPWYYVSWVGCNPALVTKVRKSTIPGRVLGDLERVSLPMKRGGPPPEVPMENLRDPLRPMRFWKSVTKVTRTKVIM